MRVSLYGWAAFTLTSCLSKLPTSTDSEAGTESGTSPDTDINTVSTAETATATGDTSETTVPPAKPVVWEHALLGTVVSLPGATFEMGASPSNLDAQPDELPQHDVTLSAFTIMQREVTQLLFGEVTGLNPSFFSGCPQCPVESVSWDDAVAFAAAVNAQTGESWRLPTEAEWEYAARGGEPYLYAGSDDVGAVAWTYLNANSSPHPTCDLLRNGFELCDGSGNIHEWVADWYGAYPKGKQVDPTGPATGTHRVYRGGSWAAPPTWATVSIRLQAPPSTKNWDIGFRLVKSDP